MTEGNREQNYSSILQIDILNRKMVLQL